MVMEAVSFSIEIRCRLSTTYQLPDSNTDTMLMLKYYVMMSKRPARRLDGRERESHTIAEYCDVRRSSKFLYRGVEVLTSEPRVRRICRILWKYIERTSSVDPQPTRFWVGIRNGLPFFQLLPVPLAREISMCQLKTLHNVQLIQAAFKFDFLDVKCEM